MPVHRAGHEAAGGADPDAVLVAVQCFNVTHFSNRTTSFTNYYVRSGRKITAISSTFGQLTRIPFADPSGVARQFQVGARFAFRGQGSGPRISVYGSKKCTSGLKPRSAA
jgi:hypothetical protein